MPPNREPTYRNEDHEFQAVQRRRDAVVLPARSKFLILDSSSGLMHPFARPELKSLM